MENRRIEKIEVKLTPKEKELIKNYCGDKGITVSDFIRAVALNKIAIQEEKK